MSSSKLPQAVPAEREPQNEREVLGMFNDKRQRLDALWTKINELVAEVQEHELVIKALTDMDVGRKCFRLVGDVLVERTVGETLPAVNKHMHQVLTVVETLQQSAEVTAKSLSEFQDKYKIRVRSANDEEEAEEEAVMARRGKVGPSQQGVLVAAQ